MRIRQRKLPFPLSTLSQVLPLSDPHLTTQRNSQETSDSNKNQQNNPIGVIQDSSEYLLKKEDEEKKVLLLQDEELEEKKNKKKVGEREKSNDVRRGSFFSGAKISTVVFHEASSSHQDDEMGSDEEKALKKKSKARMKPKMKMNKRSMQRNGDEEEGDEDVKEPKEGNSSNKKRVRGGALMEGSRCSRVNGRGWRCCQQTLVGYSLCEHHLGKGRLRSMNSVRSRSIASNAASKKVESKPLSSGTASAMAAADEERKSIAFDNEGKHGDGDEEEKQQPLLTTKKRQKLGVVKARSISSLLSRADADVVEVEGNDA